MAAHASLDSDVSAKAYRFYTLFPATLGYILAEHSHGSKVFQWQTHFKHRSEVYSISEMWANM
jgi:hypothetical protein